MSNEEPRLIYEYKGWLLNRLYNRDPDVTTEFRENTKSEKIILPRYESIKRQIESLLDHYLDFTHSFSDFDRGLIELCKHYNKDYYEPRYEGIGHINVYSKSTLELGRLLSNLACVPFTHPRYGQFDSVEGLWYYLKTGIKYEIFRKLSGVEAKAHGKLYSSVELAYFNDAIRQGITAKILQNEELKKLFTDSQLPFANYYYYGDIENPKIYPQDKHYWQVSHLEALRSHLSGEDCAKLIIAGSRDIDDYHIVEKAYYESRLQAQEIVSGLARGADTLGSRLGENLSIPVKGFEANWQEHGKKAGILRNIEMGDYADTLMYAWKGQSKGTKHMIDYMQILKKKTFGKIVI